MPLEMTETERERIEAQAEAEANRPPVKRPTAAPPPNYPSWWHRFWLFVGVVLGPKVDGATYRQRRGVCARCPDRDVSQRRYKIKEYCGACGCPRWWFAKLDVKNRYKLFNCPRGRFVQRGCSSC